jgi:hypothetical protein
VPSQMSPSQMSMRPKFRPTSWRRHVDS